MKKLLWVLIFGVTCAQADVVRNFVFQNDSKNSLRIEYQLCNNFSTGTECNMSKVTYIPAEHSTIDSPIKLTGSNPLIRVNAVTIGTTRQAFGVYACTNQQDYSLFLFKKIKQAELISCITGSY